MNEGVKIKEMIKQCPYCKKEYKQLSTHLKKCKFNDGTLEEKVKYFNDENLPFCLIKYAKFDNVEEEKKIKQYGLEAIKHGKEITEKLLTSLE